MSHSGAAAARVVVVDYGLGNLFSVRQACESAGLDAVISSESDVIRRAHALILPGVGAFPRAMQNLLELGLVDEVRAFAATGRPMIGICLGMQLLMDSSEEFGSEEGLRLVPGVVRRLNPSPGFPAKIPHVGWNRLNLTPDRTLLDASLLSGFADGAYMYFVHSYCVHPSDAVPVLSTTEYGNERFCSAFQFGAITGVQGHPERSGADGLRFYRNFAALVNSSREDSRATSI